MRNGSMGDALGPVWVIAEQVDGRLQTISLQLVHRARQLADELRVPAEAVVLGEGMPEQAGALIAAGADRVYLGDSPGLRHYQPELYTAVLVDLAQKRKPEIILVGSTPVGEELAPMVAAKLDSGVTAHTTELALNEEGLLEQRVPAYGGVITIICPARRPQMATVARGVFATPVLDTARMGEIVHMDVPADLEQRVQTLETILEPPQGVPLESANTVVAGGAGVDSAEGWRLLSELAGVLNAAVGSTRPAVDEGLAGLETMIGQSGKMVSPELYIGVGLSGEQQHMVGITDAQVMVAINSDVKAPVFTQVDLGVVDDFREFLPVLIRKIKEHRLA